MGMLQNFNKRNNHIAAHDPAFALHPSLPLYPKPESGVCLVVGTHPCANADIDAALLKFPNAKICGVNDAALLIPCDHIATCHPEKIELFLQKHVDVWDDIAYPAPALHVQNIREARAVKIPVYKWAHNFGGGSAIFAAAAMIAIGFDKVILCGCPIDGGGGYAIDTHQGTAEDPRLGDMFPKHSMVQAWHQSIDAMIARAPHVAEKIRSMSGHTQNRFGGIEQ